MKFKTSEEAISYIENQGKEEGYTLDVTGDACQGDEVMFARDTFSGSYRKPKYTGTEVITGTIVSDSYGKGKQQHTFTIKPADGSRAFQIKGRNLYRNITMAKQRDMRELALEEKHLRGALARQAREERRNQEFEQGNDR